MTGSRAQNEADDQAFFGVIQPALASAGATVTPSAASVESQVFTMTANLTVNGASGARAIGDKLYLVFIQGGASGGYTIAFATGAGGYRNAPTGLSTGALNTRVSLECRWDGVAWQVVGTGTAWA